MAVAKKETPAWMRRPVAIAAFHAIIFLHFGMVWVAAAGFLAWVAGRRFFGEVEGSPTLSAAVSVVRYSLAVAILLCPAAAKLVCSRGMWSVSEDAKKAIKDPLTVVVIGGVVLVAFMVLIAAADFVVGQSPLKRSQSAQVGSIWRDLGLVGVVGVAVPQYFIFFPMKAPKQRRMK